MESSRNFGKIRQFLTRNNKYILYFAIGIAGYAHMLLLSSALKGEIPRMKTSDLETEKEEIQEFVRSIRNKLAPWSGEKDSDKEMPEKTNSKPAS